MMSDELMSLERIDEFWMVGQNARLSGKRPVLTGEGLSELADTTRKLKQRVEELEEALSTFVDWWVEEANAVDPRLGHKVASDQRVQDAVDLLAAVSSTKTEDGLLSTDPDTNQVFDG